MSTATKELSKAEAGNGSLPVSSNPTVVVGKMVSDFMQRGSLHLPADYSPENALKSAWLALQGMDGALACTKESVINSLLDMVVQGLNPAKKQCYLIPYGNKLVCQRSYFGEMALAERVRPGISIYCDVIYEGEAFAVSKMKSNNGFITVITKHEQPFPRPSKKIVGAYCGAIDTATGEDLGIELMDWDQIQQSWKKSKTMGKGSTFHSEQPDQAAKRTVIRRWAKPIINSSNDALLLESMRRQEEDQELGEMDGEVLEHANGEVIDLSPALEANAAAEPVEEAEPVQAAIVTNPEGEGPGF